jgi:hypothetical protein
MTGVSQRAYARLRGVAMSAVQKAIASKRITPNPDGTIDPQQANEEWERNTFAGKTLDQATQQAAKPRTVPLSAPQPPRGGTGMPNPPEVSSDPVTAYLRARAVTETYKARTAQLEYEERAGKLIPATKAGEYASSFSNIARDQVSAWADRLTINIRSAAALYKKLITTTEGYVDDVPIIQQAVAVKAAIDAMDTAFAEDRDASF